MLVSATSSVLANERWYGLLDTLVEIMELPNSPHSFDPVELSTILSSEWLKTSRHQRAGLADILKTKARSFNVQLAPGTIKLRIDDTAPKEGRIRDNTLESTPINGVIYLSLPMLCIVENEISDGAFILWMARVLGRDRISRAYRAGHFAFRHAGGKGEVIKSAQALTYGAWLDSKKPIRNMKLRCCVVIDSDSDFEGHYPNINISKSAETCAAFSHTLSGRYIENYVPRKFMLKWAANDRGRLASVEAFFRLTTTQRRFFPLKSGFRATNTPLSHGDFLKSSDFSAEVKSLYASVNAADWQLVSGGFGKSLADVYAHSTFRCSSAGETGQLDTESRNELMMLIAKIEEHL